VAAAHWSACFWGALAAPLFVDDPLDSWVGRLGYCRPSTDVLDPGLFVIPRGEALCVDTGRIYLAALYWAFLLVTNTGYSDMAFHSDSSTTEQFVSILIIGVAQSVWAHVLATFTGILISSNPHTREFRHNMDQLNRFLKDQPTSILSANTRTRLREYMHQSRHIMIDASNKRLIELMSPALQGEVAFKINRIWLERVLFLRGAEPAFMVALALELTPMVFAPGEEPMLGFLYIVHRGLALHAGKVLSAGKVWGEDMILFSAELRTVFCAKAMNYLEVHMIGRDELLDIAILYPRTYRKLRRQIALLALRRGIIRRAKALLGFDESTLLAGRHDVFPSREATKTKKKAFLIENVLQAATTKSAEEQEADAYRSNVFAGNAVAPPRPPLQSESTVQFQEALAEANGGDSFTGSHDLSHGLSHSNGKAAAELAASPSASLESSGEPRLVGAGSGTSGANDVLHALLQAMDALRVDVSELRKEQGEQRELFKRQGRQRQNNVTRSGVGGSRPEQRMRQRMPASIDDGASFLRSASSTLAEQLPGQQQQQPQPGGPPGAGVLATAAAAEGHDRLDVHLDA